MEDGRRQALQWGGPPGPGVPSGDDTLVPHLEPVIFSPSGIPPEAFDYRLGSRSALEWVIDQYQVKGESDPNREDDPGYIVRLVGQVVRVSIETARIVKSLPNYR